MIKTLIQKIFGQKDKKNSGTTKDDSIITFKKLSQVSNKQDEEDLIKLINKEENNTDLIFLELIVKLKNKETTNDSRKNIINTINKLFIEDNSRWQLNTDSYKRHEILKKCQNQSQTIDISVYDLLEAEIIGLLRKNSYERFKCLKAKEEALKHFNK